MSNGQPRIRTMRRGWLAQIRAIDRTSTGAMHAWGGWGIPQKSDRAEVVELQTRHSGINSQDGGHGSSIGYPPPFLATLGSGITHGAAGDHPLRICSI